MGLAAFGFSLKSILIKLMFGHGVDASTVMALRLLLSAPFFLVLALWPGLPGRSGSPEPRDWLHLVGLGFIGSYLSAWLDMLGLQYVSAGLERLILFLYPTIVVLLSAWWLHIRIGRRQLTALVLSYVGIGLVFADQLLAHTMQGDVMKGSALVFASALVYSVFLIGSSRVVHRFGAVRFTSWGMLVGTLCCLVQFFSVHSVEALRLPMSVYGLAFAMAIFSTVLPNIFMSEGLRRIGANRAALVGTIGPVVTIALGAVVLGEHIGPLQFAGAGLVLVGVFLVSARPAVSTAA